MTDTRACPHCHSALAAEERPYELRGVHLGRFTFLVCTACERLYHPRETSLAIEAAARAAGLWGREPQGGGLGLGLGAMVPPTKARPRAAE